MVEVDVANLGKKLRGKKTEYMINMMMSPEVAAQYFQSSCFPLIVKEDPAALTIQLKFRHTLLQAALRAGDCFVCAASVAPISCCRWWSHHDLITKNLSIVAQLQA